MNRMILAALALMPMTARAELAVSINDGKQLVQGEPMTVTPDSVSVIDMKGPRVIGTVQAPAAMIGPPDAVAVSPDQSFAIITASQKVNPADPMKPMDDDRVSVIGLADPAHPRVLQTIAAGPGASGVSINPAGTLVLVAARSEGAVRVFRLAGKHLTPAGRVDLGAGSEPTDVLFAPDGTHAYAVTWHAGQVMELAVEGAKVTRTGADIATGRNAYGAVITPDGRWLINTNVGGSGDIRTGTLTMIDLAAHKLVLTMAVGKTPEHVMLSPDGRLAAVVLANGAATSRSDPKWDAVLGMLKIFRIGDGTLNELASADTCHWAQGAAWSDDGHTLLQQCAGERAIQVFRFDGRTLVRDDKATMTFESRPGAVATHRSR
jgi:DNA-binding beta-propeller fold protein YncE